MNYLIKMSHGIIWKSGGSIQYLGGTIITDFSRKALKIGVLDSLRFSQYNNSKTCDHTFSVNNSRATTARSLSVVWSEHYKKSFKYVIGPSSYIYINLNFIKISTKFGRYQSNSNFVVPKITSFPRSCYVGGHLWKTRQEILLVVTPFLCLVSWAATLPLSG